MTYDFHARQYDPQIGRFWSVDPASQFPSGYTGMGNDPGNQIDPTGAWSNVVNNGETSGAGGATNWAGNNTSESEREKEHENDIATADGLEMKQLVDLENQESNPGTGSPTDVYTSNGTKVGTVQDGKTYVYIINPGSETQFWENAITASMSGNGIDLTNGTFQGLGGNYDLQSFSNWADKNGYNTANEITVNGSTESLSGVTGYSINGVSASKPYAEAVSNIIMTNGVIAASSSTSLTDHNITSSPSMLLPNEPGAVGTIHNHDVDNNVDFSYMKPFGMGSISTGGTLYFAPSPDDYSKLINAFYRSVIVTPQRILLYNNSGYIPFNR